MMLLLSLFNEKCQEMVSEITAEIGMYVSLRARHLLRKLELQEREKREGRVGSVNVFFCPHDDYLLEYWTKYSVHICICKVGEYC